MPLAPSLFPSTCTRRTRLRPTVKNGSVTQVYFTRAAVNPPIAFDLSPFALWRRFPPARYRLQSHYNKVMVRRASREKKIEKESKMGGERVSIVWIRDTYYEDDNHRYNSVLVFVASSWADHGALNHQPLNRQQYTSRCRVTNVRPYPARNPKRLVQGVARSATGWNIPETTRR